MSARAPAQLKNGLLVTVPPSLIVRAKSHFHTLPAIGVDLIIGLNGYIWISKTVKKETRLDGEEVGFGEESGEGVYSGENEVRVFFLSFLFTVFPPKLARMKLNDFE